MNIKAATALLLLTTLSMPALADQACTRTVNLGTISVPGSADFQNWFSAPTSFVDCYDFSLGGSGSVSDWVTEVDFPFIDSLDLHITSASISGTRLTVTGSVSPEWGLWQGTVGYYGQVVAKSSRSVPEPGSLALFGVGLLGVAYAVRKRAAG